MDKILDIIEMIAYEKGLDIESIIEVIKESLLKVARESFGENLQYGVEIDSKNKTLHLYRVCAVCEDDDVRLNEGEVLDSGNVLPKENFVGISLAKNEDSELEVGDEVGYPIDLENLPRSAVNSLYRELEFQFQRLIEKQLFDKLKSKIGKIVSGTVVRVDDLGNTFVEIDEIRAFLPKKNRIKGEEFAVGNVIKAVLRRVGIDKRNGIEIELSRTTPRFLEELLTMEVPEIKDGEIQINACARIPGERAKVAVSTQSVRVDPVGATVGVKGVRIAAVSKELQTKDRSESIDCIEYSPSPEIFIARALAPAIVNGVKIEDKKALVSITSDQKAKAIGKSGINIRLASMLTGYEIEIIEIEANTKEQQKDTALQATRRLFEDTEQKEEENNKEMPSTQNQGMDKAKEATSQNNPLSSLFKE